MGSDQIKDSFWNFKGTGILMVLMAKRPVKIQYITNSLVDYVDDWFLMGSPFPMLFILTSYLFFVLRCGHKFMEKRPPYDLRNTLLIYNAFQVMYSCYLVYTGMRMILAKGIIENGYCAMDDENLKYTLLAGHYAYFLAKLTELLDTVFFVMRKKWNQVSFLHVYHHCFMFSVTWITLKYETSYTFLCTGTVNSFVHVIMYAYYGLSAFPGLQKYLWWKKYITKMQLTQFGMLLIQVTWSYFVTTCPSSYFLITVAWSHGFFFIYLFTKFYFESYHQKGKKGGKNVGNIDR